MCIFLTQKPRKFEPAKITAYTVFIEISSNLEYTVENYSDCMSYEIKFLFCRMQLTVK